MTMVPELETKRLRLKALALTDAEQVQKLFPHWQVVRHLAKGIPWPFPEDGVFQFYKNVALPAIERGDEWYWTLRLKTEAEQIIGAISLTRGEVNRGFWIGVPWQGLGLMSEAVHAVTDYWFNVLGFPVLRAPKAIANEASRRISVKTGMRLVATEEGEFVCGKLPSETWEITR